MHTHTYTATVANERHSYTQRMSAAARIEAELEAVEHSYKTRSDLPTISEITERTDGEITATYNVDAQKWATGGQL